MSTMTLEAFKAHAEKCLEWVEERKEIDQEEYYWLVDNFGALMVNNLPKEFSK